MNQSFPDADDELLSRVSRMYDQLDPLPELVSAGARAAFEMRDVDAELVPLVDAAAHTVVRSEQADQILSFANDDLEIDCGLRREGRGWQLLGQIVGDVVAMKVQTMAGVQPVAVDGLGRFQFAVSIRTLCLRMETSDGRRLRTQWVTL